MSPPTSATEALSGKLRPHTWDDKPWMKTFGNLRHLHKETARIDRIIVAEFGKVEPDDWK